MIRPLPDLPEHVIGFEMIGTIDHEDYTSTLVPLVRAASAHHERLRAVCVLGDDFDGYSVAALFDDARIGLSHPHAWERIALVSDLAWVGHVSAAFGWAVPGELRTFPVSDLAVAVEWAAA